MAQDYNNHHIHMYSHHIHRQALREEYKNKRWTAAYAHIISDRQLG